MNMFYDSADPARAPNGDWAYRKCMAGYPERPSWRQPPERARNAGCTGDEAECAEWVRERLNELYNG